MDPWFDIAPMLPTWSEAAENHWWAIIVAMIALVAVPIALSAGLWAAVTVFRHVAGLFLAYGDGLYAGRADVARAVGYRGGVASGYMDVLGSSWYEGPGMSMDTVEYLEDRMSGAVPVSDKVADAGYASGKVLSAVDDNDPFGPDDL